MADACRQQGCTLTGGETSQQPGVVPEGAYVITASIVGVVEKARILHYRGEPKAAPPPPGASPSQNQPLPDI